jgi:hypothetical protein
VREFNARCTDFYVLQNGVPPTEREALDVFEQVPIGRGPEGKLTLSVFDPGGTLVGLFDLFQGYRTATDWYLGLMLLTAECRGRGLGRSLHEGLAVSRSSCR